MPIKQQESLKMKHLKLLLVKTENVKPLIII
jgi:hypothetical protein